MKCKVYGCTKCDANQNCYECDQNMELDLNTNQCILMNNVCPFLRNFIQGPPKLKQCQQECSSTFYQNMDALTCEETTKCIQIQESSSFSFEQALIDIQQVNQQQYLVLANGCTFALADKNWKIISLQILQNLPNYDDLYILNGIEDQRKSFIVGDQGGCTAGNKLVVMDFKTLKVLFVQENTIYDYNLLLVDSINQLVFLSTTAYTNTLVWYDAINRKLNSIDISYQQIYLFFQFQNKSQTSYIIQWFDNSFQKTNFLEDRSIEIQKIDQQQDLGNYTFYQFQQRNDYYIAFSYDYLGIFTILKINISSKLISIGGQIEQFQKYLYQNYLVYFSDLLNSIMYLNQKDSNLQILVLNDLSEQIIQRINLTNYQVVNFQVFEDRRSNQTLIFIFSDFFQIMNLTSFLIQQSENQKYVKNFEHMNFNYISQQSQIINVIFQMDNTMDVIVSQQIQQIRLKYNLTDYSYKINYLNPYQSETLYYDKNLIQNQNQLAITLTKKYQKNQFYILDGYQNFLNQTSAIMLIQESVQNYQKIPRINTKILSINQQTSNILQKYQFVQQINNKYILLQQLNGQIIQQYIFDLQQQKCKSVNSIIWSTDLQPQQLTKINK
ncbi:hypothetical protein TTHERM_001204221 (macronuclear) [Tetrahymena thermophila SB210]|uniref:Uncharacterized protein n=1 Tax=Tetrahymena thermophila (strain SB210) TaxID=312017 RepID=W7X9T1_TETTS|nr:hypothetical protein TTHERM_001204221 [Tetrahymena thermophila SB210]EWS76175.1 hypothetical protein TTHERM_001204221 [Tetrahymena thermophila SB210]|eukprot:XP_012651299.1 hypothetical protein TTHERM_001204221 [Tetrahymena thermophila SB210]